MGSTPIPSRQPYFSEIRLVAQGVYLSKAEVAMLDHTTPRFLGLVYSKRLAVKYEILDENEILTIGNASIQCTARTGYSADFAGAMKGWAAPQG